jgi:hypothetical protein
MREETFGVGPESHMPDALWLQRVRVLPRPKPGRKMAGPGLMTGRR